ncbi:MAG TPA: ABC transporter permease [Acidimicrobiales bacterium]|nr:ABC transporter permease [Acidimicrobiales bacterium]
MADPKLRASRLRWLVQITGLVRKELTELVRQPVLLVVLVGGPFLILVLFAGGYDEETVRVRTLFVAPEGSLYEEAVDAYGDDVGSYVEILGFTGDLIAARDRLRSGDADLVVVFPPDPAATVLAGDQARITVLHDKLDPLQQTAVEVSARVAVQELNAQVLQTLVGEAQLLLTPLPEALDDARERSGELRSAAIRGDLAGVREQAVDVRAAVVAVEALGSASSRVVESLEGEVDPEQQERLDAVATSVARLESVLDEVASDDEVDVRAASAVIDAEVDELATMAEDMITLDPAVVVRPFASDTENLLRSPVGVNDFFAPSAIALLLQHLAVTFAAMSLVREEGLGWFESYRVGPVAARHLVAGKYLAYGAAGAAVGAALVAAVVLGLDVPLRGSVGWVAGAIAALLVSSVGLGLVLSAIARTDAQAVQYAMLSLLAGLFFGGFVLELDAFRQPVAAVSWALPVTFGIRMLQDVMLRGEDPTSADLVGVTVQAVVYGGLALALVRRRLRVG